MVMTMDLIVMADTHLKAGIDRLPTRLLAALERTDAVLHAGDLVSLQALAELRSITEVHAVLGNNDHELEELLPHQLRLVLDGVRVALVHDSGPANGRAGRLARTFPNTDIVVFGHSHVPVNESGLDGQWLFNPGSPTQRRSQPAPTFGHLRLRSGTLARRQIEYLP